MTYKHPQLSLRQSSLRLFRWPKCNFSTSGAQDVQPYAALAPRGDWQEALQTHALDARCDHPATLADRRPGLHVVHQLPRSLDALPAGHPGLPRRRASDRLGAQSETGCAQIAQLVVASLALPFKMARYPVCTSQASLSYKSWQVHFAQLAADYNSSPSPQTSRSCQPARLGAEARKNLT